MEEDSKRVLECRGELVRRLTGPVLKNPRSAEGIRGR